jgi:glycosyltransferase involved in cell wall biosynthesis
MFMRGRHANRIDAQDRPGESRAARADANQTAQGGGNERRQPHGAQYERRVPPCYEGAAIARMVWMSHPDRIANATAPPRISAVIPCYNGAAFLQDALDSVASQTLPVQEIIVVDDASSDDSAGIARRAGARVIVLPRNSGPAVARNRGVEAASNELVAFLDADDVWEPAHCEIITAMLLRHPESPIGFSRIRRFGDEDSLAPAILQEDTPARMLWRLLEANIVAQSSVIVRRDQLREIGGYAEARRYSEDYDLWLRFAQKYPFVYSQSVTTNYRVHPLQATQNAEGLLRGLWEVKYEFLVRARMHESAEFVQRLERLFLSTWALSLRDAWIDRHEGHFRAILAQHGAVPNSNAIYRRWRRRYRTSWRAWLAISRVWDRLPARTRELLRPIVEAMVSWSTTDAPPPETVPPGEEYSH